MFESTEQGLVKLASVCETTRCIVGAWDVKHDNNKSSQSFLAIQSTRCNRQLSAEALTNNDPREKQTERQAASMLISLPTPHRQAD